MSDTNKVIAAILTAGRVPTMSAPGEPLSLEDWLDEYERLVKVLNDADAAKAKSGASEWVTGITDAISNETKRGQGF